LSRESVWVYALSIEVRIVLSDINCEFVVLVEVCVWVVARLECDLIVEWIARLIENNCAAGDNEQDDSS